MIVTAVTILIIELFQKSVFYRRHTLQLHSLQFIIIFDLFWAPNDPVRKSKQNQARPTRFLRNDEHVERRELGIHAIANLLCPVPQGDEMCDCHKTQ